MDWNDILFQTCDDELKRICGKENLNIVAPKLTPEKVSSRRKDDKGDFDNDKYEITLYSQAHETEEDLLHSVRHEARHAWQWIHFKDHCRWWKNNSDFYQLISSEYFADVLLPRYCSIEADAEAFAENRQSECLVPLSSTDKDLDKMLQHVVAKIHNLGLRRKLPENEQCLYSHVLLSRSLSSTSLERNNHDFL